MFAVCRSQFLARCIQLRLQSLVKIIQGVSSFTNATKGEVMKGFFWDDSLALGISDIDNQHKEFLTALRELQIELHGNVSTEAMIKKFQQVDYYRNIHFQTEETLMEPYKDTLPNYDKHIQAHKYFTENIDLLQFKFIQEGPEMARELFKFLGTWMYEHISTMDKQMSEELKKLNAPCFATCYAKPCKDDKSNN